MQRDVLADAAPFEDSQAPPKAGLTPREAAMNKEEETVLWRALEQVPEAYRVPLILYYREGQSVERVGHALGLSADAVRQRLSRGRRMLKREVAGFVEQSLERTRPGKDFTLGVLAVLPKLASFGAAAPGKAGAPAARSGGLRSLLGVKQAVAAGGAAFAVIVLAAAFYLYASRPDMSKLASASSHHLILASEPVMEPAQDRFNDSPSEEASLSPLPADEAPTVATEPQQTTGKPRVIHFPEDRFLGTLSVQTRPMSRRYRLGPNYDWFDEWEYLGPAQGDVTVPADMPVRLSVARTALRDLSPLSELGPYDLSGVYISYPRSSGQGSGEAILRHLRGLTGLRILYLCNVDAAGHSLGFLENFRELEELQIVAGYFDNSSLRYIERLESLQALLLTGGFVTDAALAGLGKLQLLRELQITADNIAGPGLTELDSIKFLKLDGAMYGDEALRYLKEMDSLRSLTLFGSTFQLSDKGLAHLSSLVNLEELRLVHMRTITDAGIVHLLPLRSLKLLDLHNNPVTDRGLAHIATMQSLEDLTLPYTGITDAGLACVAELEGLRRLRARGNCPADPTEAGAFTDRGLVYLSRLKNLEELVISSGIGITDMGLEYLAKLPNLRRLTLMANGLTENGLAALATSTSLRRLQVNGPITISGISRLNALRDLEFLRAGPAVVQDYSGLNLAALTKLENLSISCHGEGLRDEDLACLANLTRLKWLQGIGGSALSDRGMAHIEKLTALERLNIRGDLITDKGLSYLANMRAMNHLSVQGNITDRGLRHLENLDALRNLKIDSPYPFSRATIERLFRELPCLNTFNGESIGYGSGPLPPTDDE
ncbi:MAG TPA: sigma-70 family RNA polymerase sigma factor [Candidatus Hydrogenedentes bacterium]|nr:sigma-70 family RNA polymerase sigma factor [Candidatus Hydrogenedentota bacterium]